MNFSKIILYPMDIVLTTIVAWCVHLDYIHQNPINIMLIILYISVIICSIILLIDFDKIKSIVKIELWVKDKWDLKEFEEQEEIRLIFSILFVLITLTIFIIAHLSLFGLI